jgi:type II secretory pathway pseudopilin PulG
MRTPPNNDTGLTVIELAVVLFLLSVVSVMAFSFLGSTMSTAARAERNVQAERDGQLALRAMTQDLRAANPIYDACGSGYANCLEFDIKRPTSSHPDCISRMRYTIASGFVVQDRSDSACSQNRSWTGRRVIAVVNSTAPSTPLFTYADRVGQPISATASCAANPITNPCPKYAKSVTTTLMVQYQDSVPPLRLSSAASVRNNR